MARMGHDSVRAAMIYQHRTAEADKGIADAMNRKTKVPRSKILTRQWHEASFRRSERDSFRRWAVLGSNQCPLACKSTQEGQDQHRHLP